MAQVIEKDVLLPQSVLWELQRNFYNSINIRSWSDAIVPSFVTSNCFIAGCYARVIAGFVRDWFTRCGGVRTQPVHIVEVGAGHGKMGFLILKKLAELDEFMPIDHAYKYVLSDFAADNVDFWLNHPPLQPFFENGTLDCAVFDGESATSLELLKSKVSLNAESLHSPVIFICNYVFDTLRQDVFRVFRGQLQRGRCTVLLPEAVPWNVADPNMIKQVRCQWSYSPCTPEEVSDDPAMREVLAGYARRHTNASMLIPVGGISLMRNAQKMTGGRSVFLIGDKAYSQESELVGLRDPHVAIHGSFSFMVNLHAVREYTKRTGGMEMVTGHLDGFKCALLVHGVSQHGGGGGGGDGSTTGRSPLPETRLAWRECMDDFGPENFSTLQRCVKEETPHPSLKLALAIIRLAQHDADVFYKFKQTLIDRVPFASEKLQTDIFRDVLLVYEHYYPLQKSKDVAFELGRLLMGLKRYDIAVEFFRRSHEQCGEHHVSWYNMGICYNYTHQLQASFACFSRSLLMKPWYKDAIHWRMRIEARMAEEGIPTPAPDHTGVIPHAPTLNAATQAKMEPPPSPPQVRPHGGMGLAGTAGGSMALAGDDTSMPPPPPPAAAPRYGMLQGRGGGDHDLPDDDEDEEVASADASLTTISDATSSIVGRPAPRALAMPSATVASSGKDGVAGGGGTESSVQYSSQGLRGPAAEMTLAANDTPKAMDLRA